MVQGVGRVEDRLGLAGFGLRRGTCQGDVATHTLHGAAVRRTQSTCSLLGRLGVGVVGDEQVKLRLSERLSDPATDATRAASHDSNATQGIALRDQEQHGKSTNHPTVPTRGFCRNKFHGEGNADRAGFYA